jgi:hypothetical protein
MSVCEYGVAPAVFRMHIKQPLIALKMKVIIQMVLELTAVIKKGHFKHFFLYQTPHVLTKACTFIKVSSYS